jgi:predicted nucleotidyltransferase
MYQPIFYHRIEHVLRICLEETFHGTEFQNKLTMYIEILETQGTEQAHQQFPEIVCHLEACEVCRTVVADTQSLLHEMEEIEDVMPRDVEEAPQVQEDRELNAKPLSDEFLNMLVTELDNDDIVGIILGGSYARDEATPYSDVDIACFVADSSKLRPKRFLYREGRLVSIGSKSIEGIRHDLTKPERAILFTAGQRRILLDKDGSVTKLMQDIDEFQWKPLQTAAGEYASFHMMLLAEDVHKVLSALLTSNQLALAYIVGELLFGLTRIVAVQRGILVKSDSTYYQQVYEMVGQASAWTYYHRIASAIDMAATVRERGMACLRLYQETAQLLRPVLQAEHREVVEEAVSVIDHARIGE